MCCCVRVCAAGVNSILALVQVGITVRMGLPRVPYATALDIFMYMCLVYALAALMEYAAVNYFTKLMPMEGGFDEEDEEEEAVGDVEEEEEEEDDGVRVVRRKVEEVGGATARGGKVTCGVVANCGFRHFCSIAGRELQFYAGIFSSPSSHHDI